MYKHRCNHGRLQVLLTSTVLAGLVFAAPAAAQVASADKGATIDEVIVTATKRAETLKDVPMAVDVATGEQIQKFNLFNLKDIQTVAPGLQIANSSGRNNVATLRGISFNPDIGGPSAVAFYYNEIPIDINVISTGIYDVGQIEVLRGPQGTLRGRTAPAGAITLTTRRADLHDFTGYVQGTLSDRGGQNLQGGVSIPLVQDKLALRVAGLIDRNRVNHVTNITRHERSEQKTESFRVSLAFSPDDNFRSDLTYQYLHDRTRQNRQIFGTGNRPSLLSTFVTGPAISPSDRLAVAEGPSLYTNRTHMLTSDTTVQLPKHTLSILGGYQHSYLTAATDQDIGNAVQGYNQLLQVPQPQTALTGEVRLDSKFSGMFNYTVGVYYNEADLGSVSSIRVDQFFSNANPPTPFPASRFALPLTAQVDIINKTKDAALFGDLNFQLTDRLKFEIGARTTRSWATAQSFLTVSSPGGVGLPIPPFTNPNHQATVRPEFVTRVFHPVTGTASLSYDWTPDVTTYVTYGRSYRRGSAQLGVSSPLDSSLLVLEPETSDAGEIGLKSRLFDRRVTLNLAAFYQQFDGFIGLTTVSTSSARNGAVDGSPASISYNGDAVSKGVEMQLDTRFTPDWDLAVNASYADAHYDNANIPCNDFNFDGRPDSIGTPRVPVGQQVSFCRVNSPLAEIPKFALSASSELRIPLSGSLEPFVRGLLTYRPSFFSEASNFDFPSVTNLNLFVGVRGPDRRWELTVFAKNLFDTTEITAIGQGEQQIATRLLTGTGTPTPFRSGYRSVTVTTPREVGVTASYNF